MKCPENGVPVEECTCLKCRAFVHDRATQRERLLDGTIAELDQIAAMDVRAGEVRCSDRARDIACGQLRNAYAEGRLDDEAFLARLTAAVNAVTENQLAKLRADLPSSLAHPPKKADVTGIAVRAVAVLAWLLDTIGAVTLLTLGGSSGWVNHGGIHQAGLTVLCGLITACVSLATAARAYGIVVRNK